MRGEKNHTVSHSTCSLKRILDPADKKFKKNPSPDPPAGEAKSCKTPNPVSTATHAPSSEVRSATSGGRTGGENKRMEKSVSIAFLTCFTQSVTPSLQMQGPRTRDTRSLDRKWNQSNGPNGPWDHTKNYKKRNDADPHRPNERRRRP